MHDFILATMVAVLVDSILAGRNYDVLPTTGLHRGIKVSNCFMFTPGLWKHTIGNLSELIIYQ